MASLNHVPFPRTITGYRGLWTLILLLLTVLNCLFQIIWFWRYTSHNINFDAVSYIGIARHLTDGHFHASLHGYWSPLVSWCIATIAKVSPDFLLAGRIVTIASFLLCLPLTYFLTLRLWHNSELAALSVFCVAVARGVTAFSVYFIGADFLLTAAVLVYFTLLLECLRSRHSTYWTLLGLAHAVAFLVKAFAMPWLAISTILGALLAGKREPVRIARYLLMASLLPILVWLSWGTILSEKYGRFTAGYQAKVNLIDPETKNAANPGELAILMNTSDTYDHYMIYDAMFPRSTLWDAHLSAQKLIPQALRKEAKNVPEAIKQIVILITPGGVLAFVLVLGRLDANQYRVEKQLAWIVAASVVTLVAGYCMLVFDDRYVLPLAPLLIVAAVSSVSAAGPVFVGRPLRSLIGILFISSTVFLLSYRASPFRSITRDYQTSVHYASATLQRLPACRNLIVIGQGPYPEHGVGWEAGIYTSYFAGCRMIGFADRVPAPQDTAAALADIRTLRGDSILLFGKPQDHNYELFQHAVSQDGHYSHLAPLLDSQVGEVGSVLSR